jgi:hypothetical protein
MFSSVSNIVFSRIDISPDFFSGTLAFGKLFNVYFAVAFAGTYKKNRKITSSVPLL